MANSTAIFDISDLCSNLFINILSKPEAASVLVTEVLHHRFMHWASYLGVFAPNNVSLDTRLKYSESINQLVLQFLQIVYRSLDRTKELDDEHLEDPEVSRERLQYLIAEQINHPSESRSSIPLVETLWALKAAIDGLYRLGIAIQQSSSSTLTQRINNFLQKNDDGSIENMVFLRLRHMFFDGIRNESVTKSPISLYRQLAVSISFRYFSILYRQRRQEKFKKKHEIVPVQTQIGNGDPIPALTRNVQSRKYSTPNKRNSSVELGTLTPASSGLKQPQEDSDAAPSTVITKNVLQRYAASEKSFSASKSVISVHVKDAKYPEPPEVNPITREARCPFCSRPIFERDLQKKGWWQYHVDRDLKLYTCISEECSEPPQFFIRFDEWRRHMDEQHSTNWIEEIHKPLGWCCDVNHIYLYFNDESKYDQHVQTEHPEYETEKAELKELSELQRARPSYTCPICNSIPEELAIIFPWICDEYSTKSEAIGTKTTTQAPKGHNEAARDKLLLHIGTHLKQLGLLSVLYLGDDAEDKSMDNKSTSILVSMGGKLKDYDMQQDPETPPDYLDPQFKDYVMPPELELLEHDVDWRDINKFDIANDSKNPFMIPYPRNKEIYISSASMISNLVRSVDNGWSQTGCNRIVVAGRGPEKVHITLEALFRLRNMDPFYPIFWINASQFKLSMKQIAILLGLRLSIKLTADEMEDNVAIKFVNDMLGDPGFGRWLLVLEMEDDVSQVSDSFYDELSWILNILPSSSEGTIIFVLRNYERWASLITCDQILFIPEDAPAAPFYTRAFQSALRDGEGIAHAATEALAGMCELDNNPVLQALRSMSEGLSKYRSSETKTIAILGDSGEGKSSLINSLLQCPGIAPTVRVLVLTSVGNLFSLYFKQGDLGSACTTVMTEYRQKLTRHTAPITIEVERLSSSEIHELVKELVWNYRKLYLPSFGEEKVHAEDYWENKRQSEMAWSILEAAFKHRREFKQDLLRDMSEGATEGIVSQLTQWTEELEWPEGSVRANALWKSTAETAEECCDKTAAFAHDKLWPFTKVIRVYLSSQVLKTGIVLADLPGLQDTNLAQVRTTQDYLLRCDHIFIVAKISRAITDQSLKSSLYYVLSKHIPLEWEASAGRFLNLAVICTRAEDINEKTARKAYCGPDKPIPLNIMEEMDKRILAAKGSTDRKLKKKLLRQQKFLLIEAQNSQIKAGLQSKYAAKVPGGILEVFCVSNPTYEKYVRKGDLHMVDASGIPALRSFCYSITAQKQLLEAKHYLATRLGILLNSIQIAKKFKVVNAFSRAKTDLTRALADQVLELIDRRSKQWGRAAATKGEEWDMWHWALGADMMGTIRAIHVEPNTPFFATRRSYYAADKRDRIQRRPINTGFQPRPKVCLTHLQTICPLTIDYRTIRRKASEGNSGSYIVKEMIPAYRSACYESGPGMSMRQRTIVQARITDETLFPNISIAIKDQVEGLTEQTLNQLQEKVLKILERIQVALVILMGEETVSQTTEKNNSELEQRQTRLESLLRKHKERHNKILEDISSIQ
ncbi:hypothetical protein B7463_g12581, partial [Scytalidium lignicola]